MQPAAPASVTASAIETLDWGWVCDPARLPRREGETAASSYVRTVEELATAGFGCYPDPVAGDGVPNGAAPLVVYDAHGQHLWRETHPLHELHLHLLCAMSRADGDVSSSEYAHAMRTATRLAGSQEIRAARYHALVAWRLRVTDALDPFAPLLRRHSEADSMKIYRALSDLAWVDGYCHPAEARMLAHVEEIIGLDQAA